MTESIHLSIGITVYNQIDAVRENLMNILRSPRQDFEVILQDDCSQDDIGALVRETGDHRVRHCRNSVNLGHDGNILAFFKNCRAEFAFLLRSADTLTEDGIDRIVAFIEEHPDTGYCRFSCVDERGVPRIRYEDAVLEKGPRSVELHQKVLIHPSGELYNLRYFDEEDWACYSRYLDEYFDNGKKFIVHTMMRCKLALCAGISTSSDVVWKYARTNKRQDVAQNRSSQGMCIYHPMLQYQRYHCLLSYVVDELNGAGKEQLIRGVIDSYAWLIIFVFRYINRDREMQRHYCFEEIPFSSRQEMHRFREKTLAFAEEYGEPYRSLVKDHCSGVTDAKLVRWQMERARDDMRGILAGVKRRIPGLK